MELQITSTAQLITALIEKGGIYGIMIAGLAAYIYFLHKQFGKEREDFKQIARDGFGNIKENTAILSSLKTLFESTREKLK